MLMKPKSSKLIYHALEIGVADLSQSSVVFLDAKKSISTNITVELVVLV